MEFDLFAIKDAPFGWMRIRPSVRVYSAKFHRMILNPIFITRTANL
jgi:hypothetical protein